MRATSRIGERRIDGPLLDVTYPYTGEVVGQVSMIGPEDVSSCVSETRRVEMTRHERSEVLTRARALLSVRRESFAEQIRLESGLCRRETLYEVGRALDVLQFSAMEALRDDGQIFSCDISANGKARKIFTTREPLDLVFAITPFNHPLNQVAHKVAPAIAAGAPMVLKPSEKTPLTAFMFADLLLEAGLPPSMLSVIMGPIVDVVEPLIRHESVDLVSFTGSASIGKRIASQAGYKKLCLELGGNSPLIVLKDADLELAVKLACEGSFRNSGQRCTAVKRILVADEVLESFTTAFVERARTYVAGDPADESTVVGTVIDEAAAQVLESRVREAVGMGARVLLGGGRRGAQMEPTVIADVPRSAPMVVEESFGPLAPIMSIRDVDDAIDLANGTAFGLSTGVVTNSLSDAMRVIRGVRTGTVNVNEVPGYRIESSPFGGVKDSGLGIKEGVIEAMRMMTTVKTFSLPW